MSAARTSELCFVCSRSSSPDKPSVSCEDARAERWSTQNAERPRLLFRSAFRRHVLPRGGRCGAARVRSLSPPCRAKPSEVGSASWLASQSALPAAHIICARTWGGTTRSQYTVPRKLRPPLDMPIRALRQQAATYGSEWPRESGAHPWRVPTHSGFTRPRSGMKGPDWGLAGAGTTVK